MPETQCLFFSIKVESLIKQVADENGLEIMDQLAEVNPASGSLASTGPQASKRQEDELDRR